MTVVTPPLSRYMNRALRYFLYTHSLSFTYRSNAMDPFGYNRASDAGRRAGGGLPTWRDQNRPGARSPIDERYELGLVVERLDRLFPRRVRVPAGALVDILTEFESVVDPDDVDTPKYKTPKTLKRKRPLGLYCKLYCDE